MEKTYRVRNSSEEPSFDNPRLETVQNRALGDANIWPLREDAAGIVDPAADAIVHGLCPSRKRPSFAKGSPIDVRS